MAIFIELGWVKFDNNRFLPLKYFRGGGRDQQLKKVLFTELGWGKYDNNGFYSFIQFGGRNQQHKISTKSSKT